MAEGFVFSVGSSGGSNSDKEPPDRLGEVMKDVRKQAKVSFRDMVMGTKDAPPARPKVDLYKAKLAKLVFEGDNPLKPMVHIHDSMLQGLCAPWQDALVVKLLDKSIGYNVMKDRLTRLWKLTVGFDIMDIGHDFYMVKFEIEADRNKVIDGGPCMIFDHYLSVQQWSKDFLSPIAKIEKTMVWIRFPGLNVYYYDESILLAMAAAVGRPVRVDNTTLGVHRGRFARVCVEVDLIKPVVGKVGLNGFWYKVEYEGLHRICTVCGCYSHLRRNCKNKTEAKEVPAANLSGAAAWGQVDVNDDRAKEKPVAFNLDMSVAENQEEALDGDWMIAKHKSRPKKINANDGKKSVNNYEGKRQVMNHKGNNSKSHANRDIATLKNNSMHYQVAPSFTPKFNAPGSMHDKVKNKRQRNDDENPTWQFVQHAMKDKGTKSTKSNTHKPLVKNTNVVHDLGRGVRSTVKMKVVSDSRFIMLHEDS